MTDAPTLAAGSNISITRSGNTLTLSAIGGSNIWQLNGSNAYYNGGKVGVGTNTPAYKLHISERFRSPWPPHSLRCTDHA
ncbi:MAG: hypothetical protein ABIR71_08255 [Chthoniobacterales bacterium]